MTKFEKEVEVAAIDELMEELESDLYKEAKSNEYSEESCKNFRRYGQLLILVNSLKTRLDEIDEMHEKIDKMYAKIMRG